MVEKPPGRSDSGVPMVPVAEFGVADQQQAPVPPLQDPKRGAKGRESSAESWRGLWARAGNGAGAGRRNNAPRAEPRQRSERRSQRRRATRGPVVGAPV